MNTKMIRLVDNEGSKIAREASIEELKLEPWQQCLLDAANLIEKEGHWRGIRGYASFPGERDGNCVLTAIMRVHTFRSVREMAQNKLKEALNVRWISTWSDTSPTDVVLKTLRDVALVGTGR